MNYLSIALALAGLVILFAPQYIYGSHSVLQYIRDHNVIVGGLLLVAAYFTYPKDFDDDIVTDTSSPVIEVASQSADGASA
jgi:hypothetical protein